MPFNTVSKSFPSSIEETLLWLCKWVTSMVVQMYCKGFSLKIWSQNQERKSKGLGKVGQWKWQMTSPPGGSPMIAGPNVFQILGLQRPKLLVELSTEAVLCGRELLHYKCCYLINATSFYQLIPFKTVAEQDWTGLSWTVMNKTWLVWTGQYWTIISWNYHGLRN